MPDNTHRYAGPLNGLFAIDSILLIPVSQTDIEAGNIMFGIGDDSVFTEFMLEEAELNNPSPRKEDTDGRTIYASQKLNLPKE